MPSASKRKGNVYERELVNWFKSMGWHAERAYASNGRALGEGEEVDLVIESPFGHRFTVQAKRRKSIASYILPPDDAQVTMIRQDRGGTYVVLPIEMFEQLAR